MKEGLLVDAYNVLYAARASSHARFFPDIKRLAYLVEHYAADRGMRAVLVVDGSRFSDEWTNTRVLTVLCSRGGEAADAVMEAWMAQLPKAERMGWALVSNDVNLCRMGSGMGLRVRPCDVLVGELAAFANLLPTHSLDFRRPSKPGISRPFNNPFGRLSAVAIAAAAFFLFPAAAAAAEFGGFSHPEAVVCDPAGGQIYVTNSIPPPTGQDQSQSKTRSAQAPSQDPSAPPAAVEQPADPTGGFISRISSSGVVLIQKFISGGHEGSGRELHRPRDLALTGGKLYVADSGVLQVYNADTGVWLMTLRVAEPAVDIALVTSGRKGDIFAADPVSGTIYRIDTQRKDLASKYLELPALKGLTGMVMDPVSGHLFVVTQSSGQLVGIDRDKKASVVKKGLGELNGLAMDTEGNFYMPSAERGEVYRVADRGRGPLSVVASGLRSPSGIAYDAIRHGILIILKADARLTSIPLTRPSERKNTWNFVKRSR